MEKGINNICHSGVVERVERSVVYVRIMQQSACSGCHAKSLCTASESAGKLIEVEGCVGDFMVNDEVNVCAHTSQGYMAVMLAFVVPLLLVAAVLATVYAVSGSEIAGGVAGIAALVPYYIAMYLMRGRLKKKFVFTLSKIK
jgi:sigma-E factor negative regulatory protein RseC